MSCMTSKEQSILRLNPLYRSTTSIAGGLNDVTDQMPDRSGGDNDSSRSIPASITQIEAKW